MVLEVSYRAYTNFKEEEELAPNTAEAEPADSGRGELKHICKYMLSMAKKSSLKMIEQHNEFLTKEALFEIVIRINATEDTLEADNEAIITLLKKLELTTADYMKVSKLLSKSMSPDQRIKLFEILSEENDSLIEVYLYTLYDLGMLDLADEILRNSEETEHLIFKAYRALKNDNQNFTIDLFIS